MSTLLTRSNLSTAATVSGTLIRYSFYLIGAVVLGAIGLTMLFVANARVKQVDAVPVFRLGASELARLPVSTHVTVGSYIGRVEMRQYGQLYDRDMDLTIALVVPPTGQPITRDFIREMSDIKMLRDARAVLTSTYHDLDTRFGAIRAADMRIMADGRVKLCLAFLSRFDTPSVYVKGWYCEASGAKASDVKLACMLDRLVLDAALASSEAGAFLRERMARAPLCSAAPVTQTTDTRPRVPPPRYR